MVGCPSGQRGRTVNPLAECLRRFESSPHHHLFLKGGMDMPRVKIGLKCSECGRTNYYTTKRKDKRGKLQLRKYCPHCKKHTLHVEVKI